MYKEVESQSRRTVLKSIAVGAVAGAGGFSSPVVAEGLMDEYLNEDVAEVTFQQHASNITSTLEQKGYIDSASVEELFTNGEVDADEMIIGELVTAERATAQLQVSTERKDGELTVAVQPHEKSVYALFEPTSAEGVDLIRPSDCQSVGTECTGRECDQVESDCYSTTKCSDPHFWDTCTYKYCCDDGSCEWKYTDDCCSSDYDC